MRIIMKKNVQSTNHRFKRQLGMTLIELMIAMVILAVGLGGIMTMVVSALATNGKNRTDTTSTLLSHMVIQQIAEQPATQNTVFQVSDCAGIAWNVNTAQGGAPLRAANDPNGFWVIGDIDFSQNYGAAAPGNGYSMLYTSCGINGGQQTIYDVRWNIVATGIGQSEIVTVATRIRGTVNSAQNSNNLLYFSFPVQLKTIVGN
jgi:prepilin-type N-terminal cleavage/methylation domain-containing protein